MPNPFDIETDITNNSINRNNILYTSPSYYHYMSFEDYMNLGLRPVNNSSYTEANRALIDALHSALHTKRNREDLEKEFQNEIERNIIL